MPTERNRSAVSTYPVPAAMTSPAARMASPRGMIAASPAQAGVRLIRQVLALATAGAVIAAAGGCGSQDDLEAPAPAPAPGSSKEATSPDPTPVALSPAPPRNGGTGPVSANGGTEPVAPTAEPTAPNRSTDPGAPSPTASQFRTASILAQVNQARASARSCGSATFPAALPLAVNADTEAAAHSHTRWMQDNRTMSHTGEAGSTVGSRLTGTGYSWRAVGENVAMGQSNAAAVVAAWLASPGHCANIMNGTFVDVGFSFAPATANARTYATMVLARPR